MTLDLAPRITRQDDFYELLVKAHEGLSAEQSAALNARLILILANQIGDFESLRAAVELARTPER